MCHGSRFSARQRARDLALVRVPLIRDDQLLSVVAILRKLSDEEMAEYRRPFAEPGEGRRPTLTWPRQIPIEGEPADVHAIATEYAEWLGTSNVPKLFLKAEPGAILTNDTLVNLVRGWPALTERTVTGIHFVQEDSPEEIGKAIVDWMGTLG
jgi:haloalkane dehalogenase